MNSLQTIIFNIKNGTALSSLQVQELSSLVSLGFNSRGRIDRDYGLRSEILSVLVEGEAVRVKTIQERLGGYSIQRITGALKALAWAGAIDRKTVPGEKITVDKYVGREWDEDLRWYRFKYEKVEIETKVALFTKII